MEWLNVVPREVCELIEPLGSPGARVIVGHSYLYDVEVVRASASRQSMHLDAWFIRRVAELVYRNRPKHPCIFFWSLGRIERCEFVRLTISEQSGILHGIWLAEIAGFFEFGKELLPSSASLWAIWEGGALARVHDFLDEGPSGLMVVDLGGMQGISIFTDQSEDVYESIKADPIERWDYCPIPPSATESIELDRGAVVTLRHLAYRSLPHSEPEGEEASEGVEADMRQASTVSSQITSAEILEVRMGNPATRRAAIVEACERGEVACIPAIVREVAKLTWADVERVRDALPALAPAIVGPLIDLLASRRKQTAEVVTGALGMIRDPKTCFPLLEMMEQQSGTANAIRARDALIAMGDVAVEPLTFALDFDGWETRMYAAQALEALGALSAISRLREAAESDRSGKVREVAREALRSLEQKLRRASE